MATSELTASAPGARDSRKIFAITLVACVVIDQLIKAWIRHVFATNLAALQSRPFPGIFELTYSQNQGIAFGFFQGSRVLTIPIALGMVGFATYASFRHKGESRMYHFAFGLLAAGALGNLIDRFFLGFVTDMFYFRLINFPVFNFADACITAFGVLLFISILFEKPAAKATASQGAPIENSGSNLLVEEGAAEDSPVTLQPPTAQG